MVAAAMELAPLLGSIKRVINTGISMLHRMTNVDELSVDEISDGDSLSSHGVGYT